MALKAVVDDIDTVDEAKRDLYVEREGKFVLDVDESFRAHPQVVGLKNTLEKFKGYLNTVKDVLNGTEVDITKMDGVLKPVLARIKEVREEKPEGYDPEELERLRTELAAREKDPENKELRQRLEAQFAQSRADDAKKTAAELKRRDIKDAEKDEIISGFQTKFRNGIIDKALDDAADAASVKPALRKAFKAQMREEAGLEIEEGDEGRPTVKVKLALGGDPLDVYAKIFTQSDDGKHFVDPATGSGAPGGDNKRAGKRPEGGNWAGNAEERRKAILNKFPELAKKSG